MSEKAYKPQKATGISVETFYDAQDAAMQEKSPGKRTNLLRYSVLLLARVEPMPTLDEFRALPDDEIDALVRECKQLNPRHFDLPQEEPGGEKKSAS